LYKVPQRPLAERLKSSQECITIADLVVLHLRHKSVRQEEMMKQLRDDFGANKDGLGLEEEQRARVEALNTMDGNHAAFAGMNNPPPTPWLNQFQEWMSQFDDVCNQPGKSSSFNHNTHQSLPPSPSAWERLTGKESQGYALDIGKSCLFGAAVGLVTGLCSEQFRILMTEFKYGEAAKFLMKSAGCGGGFGGVGRMLQGAIETLLKTFFQNSQCWMSVCGVVIIFQIISLVLQYGEKGSCWSFFRDFLGSASTVVVVTVSAACFAAIPAALLSFSTIKLISSLKENYDLATNENPTCNFLKLLPMACKGVLNSFQGACEDWREWLGSFVLGGTPVAKLMRAVEQVDEEEQRNDLREKTRKWENVPRVFCCPVRSDFKNNKPYILQHPRYVGGRFYERDVLMKMVEAGRSLPGVGQFSLVDIERSEEFETCLNMYVTWRFKEEEGILKQ